MASETAHRILHRMSFNNLKILMLFAFLGGATVLPAPALAQASAAAGRLSYADIADLVTASPVIVSARVKGTKGVKMTPATGGPPSEYLLVRAQVQALIRGRYGILPIVTFLARAEDAKRLYRSKARLLLFALPTSKPDQLQLVSRYAAQPMTPQLDTTVRALAAEVLRADSPPRILAVGDAFHSAGTVAGEGETQIFLKTETQAPISLSILRRPGQPARWGVSLGEIVDETAVPPQPDSLLWYRLACSLPAQLPFEAIRNLLPQDGEAARRDYAFVMESLGSCGRTL